MEDDKTMKCIRCEEDKNKREFTGETKVCLACERTESYFRNREVKEKYYNIIGEKSLNKIERFIDDLITRPVRIGVVEIVNMVFNEITELPEFPTFFKRLRKRADYLLKLYSSKGSIESNEIFDYGSKNYTSFIKDKSEIFVYFELERLITIMVIKAWTNSSRKKDLSAAGWTYISDLLTKMIGEPVRKAKASDKKLQEHLFPEPEKPKRNTYRPSLSLGRAL